MSSTSTRRSACGGGAAAASPVAAGRGRGGERIFPRRQIRGLEARGHNVTAGPDVRLGAFDRGDAAGIHRRRRPARTRRGRRGLLTCSRARICERPSFSTTLFSDTTRPLLEHAGEAPRASLLRLRRTPIVDRMPWSYARHEQTWPTCRPPPIGRDIPLNALCPAVRPLKRDMYTPDTRAPPERNWSGRRDSNPRPQPWQGCALPLSYTRIRAAFFSHRPNFLCQKGRRLGNRFRVVRLLRRFFSE